MSTGLPGAGTFAAPLVSGEPVEVADRVFVLPDRRVPLVPNVGIVLGDRAALVIDTGIGPRNGDFVLRQARRLAGQRRIFLALTQLDPGHGFGAQAFKGKATILYSAAQRQRLRDEAQSYVETFAQFGSEVAGELDGLELVDADLVFDERLELQLGGVGAQLTTWGPAHNADNQTVLIDDRVLFGGDLFETRMFPVLPYFPPFDNHFDGDRWIAALDALIALDVECVVPGHGEVTDVAQISAVREYLDFMRERTRQARRAELALAEATEAIEEQALARWPGWDEPQWIQPAIRAFYEHHH